MSTMANVTGRSGVDDDEMKLVPIGYVESVLRDRSEAPRQGDEGAPDAWLALSAEFADGLRDIAMGDELLVLTWLHLSRRDELVTRPRNDPRNPITGVFRTRSPNRPNPIAIHRVRVLAVEGTRIKVSDMEAVDATPVIDIKPVLDRRQER
jgi:tRNA-Thr(GGU) m(6)t(6)A37 methyltransferase TsaA